MIKLTKIKSNPNNPRIIKDEKFKQLVKSIKDFPEMMAKRPIVCVTDADGLIFPLGGNMRLKALQELKYKSIPDEWVTLADEWTDEQRREFIIKDNVGFGNWDWDDLANNWDAEQITSWGLDIPNFTEAEAAEEKDPFADEGIDAKNQYGVIVMCENEGNQESVFRDLTNMGFNCKVVVT